MVTMTVFKIRSGSHGENFNNPRGFESDFKNFFEIKKKIRGNAFKNTGKLPTICNCQDYLRKEIVYLKK